jgi:transposase
MALTRQQRERLVLDLYNQGKNTREIAEEARMSFSAIGAILKKAEQENETSKEQTEKMSQAAQAYKLFSAGKSPVEVAIALNLRQAEVTEFYKEYWILEHQYDLSQIYEEIKGDIGSFLNLYKLAKAEGMNIQQVIRLLKIANDHLPAVKQRYESLKREVDSLEGDKRNSAMILQQLSDHISDLCNTSDSFSLSCEEEKRQVAELHQKKTKLEALVNDFQNNNEIYLQIKQTVKREVEIAFANRRQLLRLTLVSLIESLRRDPRKFYALYYNMSSSSSAKSPSSSSSSSPKTTGIQQQYDYVPFMNEQNSPIIDYSNEEICEKILLDQSEEIYDKMIQDLTIKTVPAVASDSDSSLSSSP